MDTWPATTLGGQVGQHSSEDAMRGPVTRRPGIPSLPSLQNPDESTHWNAAPEHKKRKKKSTNYGMERLVYG